METDSSNVTLAILAGGEGSRMGVPKGHLRIDGQPILRFLLARFSWPGPTLLVTAPGREHPPGCEAFAREAVDPVAGSGPLRGVLTALENATTDDLVVATVDMPGVGAEQLGSVVRAFRAARERRPALAGLMTCRPCGDGGREVEPFPASLGRGAREVVGGRLRAGRLSVRGLAEDPGFLTVPAPESWDQLWRVNLNRPQDLEAFLRDREQRESRS